MLENFEKAMKQYHREREVLAKQHLKALHDFQNDVNRMFREEEDRLQRIVSQITSAESKLPSEGTFTAEITTAVYAMLTEERPLHRQVIYDRLKAQGVHVGGKDALGNLSAYLSSDSRFKTAGRGEWTLASASLMPIDMDDVLMEIGPMTREKMKAWFYRHYEDPAHSVNYENGYVWLGRGPHDAAEVLAERFGSIAEEQEILGLLDELEQECIQWAALD